MKLRSKLVLAIVPVVAGALLVLGWAVYARLAGQAEAGLEQRMALVLERTEAQLRGALDTLHANVGLLASSELVERHARSVEKFGRATDSEPPLSRLFAQYRDAYPGYREIRFVLPDGREALRVAQADRPNRGSGQVGSGWFRRLPHDAPAAHTEFGRDEDDGRAQVLVAHPVRAAARGRRPGDGAQRTAGGWIVVVDSLDALRTAVTRTRIGTAGHLRVTDAAGRTLLGHASERAEATSGIDPAGWLVRSRALPGGLRLEARVPVSELVVTRIRIAGGIAVLVAAAVMLTSGLLFLSMRRLVLDPIAALGAAARSIGEREVHGEVRGALPRPSVRTRTAAALLANREDEIGELAGALRGMQSRLERSISELRGSHDRIEQLAFRDPLTDLPNRRSFLLLVERALDGALDGALGGAATDAVATAVLFLDLDDFKRVNDTVGHEAGDELLRRVGERLQGCVRDIEPSGSPVARLGGDEFTVLLPRLARADAVRLSVEVAERIVAALTAPIRLAGRDFVVGTSIGIALAPEHAGDAATLIKCADIAMYEAKRHGPNAWRSYGHEMQRGIDRRIALEEELRLALARDELTLDFQPQFGLVDGAMIGAEALLRWHHPAHGQVSPAEFVPIAEETGLIGPIGERVLDEACRQWRAWHDAGIAPARIAVNVSQRQLSLGDLDALVFATLERHGVPTAALEVELTESCMMEAPADVVATLRTLRAGGVRVAMDDFGTGYSSLAALTSLPLDTLKIDSSFITGIRQDSPNEKVVSAILTLARELGLEIVAEGVETGSELDFLRERACDVVQGYLLSRPLSVEAMTAVLGEARAARYRLAS